MNDLWPNDHVTIKYILTGEKKKFIVLSIHESNFYDETNTISLLLTELKSSYFSVLTLKSSNIISCM